MADGADTGTLTHPDRVLYPTQGLTKRGLAEYWTAVAPWALPHIVGRPLSLVRCPRGRQHTCFYQKHLSASAPEGVHGVEIREKEGTGVYVHVADLEGLLGLVQLGTLEVHGWGSRVDDLEHPDTMVFDLDPAPDVAWKAVIDGAYRVREFLRALHLTSFVRLSGGKGVHVVVPLARRAEWGRVKQFARDLANAMVRDDPSRWVATASKSEREGRIFLDWLRNARGATAVVNYSTRARSGAPVATPLRWDELKATTAPDRYTTRSIRRRLAALSSDPWEGYFETRQSITRAAELALVSKG